MSTCSETKCSEQNADAAWRPPLSRRCCHVLNATTVSRWSLLAPATGAASFVLAACLQRLIRSAPCWCVAWHQTLPFAFPSIVSQRAAAMSHRTLPCATPRCVQPVSRQLRARSLRLQNNRDAGFQICRSPTWDSWRLSAGEKKIWRPWPMAAATVSTGDAQRSRAPKTSILPTRGSSGISVRWRPSGVSSSAGLSAPRACTASAPHYESRAHGGFCHLSPHRRT